MTSSCRACRPTYVDSLRAWSDRDADAYPDFDRLVRSLGRFLGDIAAQTSLLAAGTVALADDGAVTPGQEVKVTLIAANRGTLAIDVVVNMVRQALDRIARVLGRG